jgi:predicted Zn-dependent protease
MQGDFRRGSNVFPTRWKTPPAEDLARMALVQLHVKDRKGAVTQAERAIDLGDKTALPQVVLAQALLATKQDEKAAVAIKKVQEIDPDLAKRIEGRPGGWKNAIRALSPKDLRLPLDPVTAKRS